MPARKMPAAPIAQCQWLRNLPEAGTVANLAAKEEDLLARRAYLTQQIDQVDADLRALADRAASEARGQWTDDEIASAKRKGFDR